jgi:adenylate kinase
MIIIVTGTPGTGKTLLAKKLAKKTHHQYIGLTEWIKKNKLYSSIEDGCLIVDIPVFLKSMNTLLKKNVVIDGHLSHFLASKNVDLCFVTKCSLPLLKKRLEKRNYSPEKVRENLDCEIFDVCYQEAIENGHAPIVVCTDNE